MTSINYNGLTIKQTLTNGIKWVFTHNGIEHSYSTLQIAKTYIDNNIGNLTGFRQLSWPVSEPGAAKTPHSSRDEQITAGEKEMKTKINQLRAELNAKTLETETQKKLYQWAMQCLHYAEIAITGDYPAWGYAADQAIEAQGYINRI
jgi:hypothetical protein